MSYYYVRLSDGTNVSVTTGTKEEALSIATEATGKESKSADLLPYPSGKQVGPVMNCPSFCYTPEQCKGRSCCPKSYACSE